MLEVKKLHKHFDKLKVLNGIDLTVKESERIVIIGPSGSGKSTFLRCLNLLEKPTKGEVIFKGKTLNNSNKKEIRKKMGMVFQSFNLFENLNVLENLILAPVKTGFMTEEEATKKAIKYLEAISLLDKKEVLPKNLSGGQKQRVAIIRSMMMDPSILLVDEPTSSLDKETTKDILNLLKKVAEEGMTMIIVSHELDFAKEIATKVIFMDQGEIIETGPPEEIFSNPQTDRLKEFLSITK